MSKKDKKEYDRAYNLLRVARQLLQDKNLVWSADFGYIKDDLAQIMKEQAPLGNLANPHVLAIADKLMFADYDLLADF